MVEKQQKKEEYAQIVKSTGLLGITLFVSLVKNKVIAVLLGTSGIGLISVLNSIITMVGSFTNIGISSSAVREVAEVIDQKDNLQLVIKKLVCIDSYYWYIDRFNFCTTTKCFDL